MSVSASSLADFPASVVRLDSGLTLIHQEITATPVVVADVWVKAGAAIEPAHWSGMAHFLEHMIFKGTDRLLPGVFDQVIEGRGGLTNAATSHDYAHFFITLAAEALPGSLPYLAELLLHASIPADEFVRERYVVLEEIRQAYDDPDWVGFQALSELLYPQHPYGRSVLGTPEILNQRSPEEMRCFHQAHYQPENMAVVLAGDVTLETAVELVSQSFQRFAPAADCPATAASHAPSIAGIQRQVLAMPRLEQGRLMMAWLGPGIDHFTEACGLDLLTVLLAEGRTSRLVRELREERQWVDEVSASFSLQRDCSLFSLTLWLDQQQAAAVEALVCDRIADLFWILNRTITTSWAAMTPKSVSTDSVARWWRTSLPRRV
ncbi:MAG: insulinase family protein, partial [Leptolyngbya sp. SIO4C1]|nr:insulinase family protein [Leptolyngbya sp. SIO4C1]